MSVNFKQEKRIIFLLLYMIISLFSMSIIITFLWKPSQMNFLPMTVVGLDSTGHDEQWRETPIPWCHIPTQKWKSEFGLWRRLLIHVFFIFGENLKDKKAFTKYMHSVPPQITNTLRLHTIIGNKSTRKTFSKCFLTLFKTKVSQKLKPVCAIKLFNYFLNCF